MELHFDRTIGADGAMVATFDYKDFPWNQNYEKDFPWITAPSGINQDEYLNLAFVEAFKRGYTECVYIKSVAVTSTKGVPTLPEIIAARFNTANRLGTWDSAGSDYMDAFDKHKHHISQIEFNYYIAATLIAFSRWWPENSHGHTNLVYASLLASDTIPTLEELDVIGKTYVWSGNHEIKYDRAVMALLLKVSQKFTLDELNDIKHHTNNMFNYDLEVFLTYLLQDQTPEEITAQLKDLPYDWKEKTFSKNSNSRLKGW